MTRGIVMKITKISTPRKLLAIRCIRSNIYIKEVIYIRRNIYIMLSLEQILYLCVDLLIYYVTEHGWAMSFNILLL